MNIIQENPAQGYMWTKFPHLFEVRGGVAYPLSELTNGGREDGLANGYQIAGRSCLWFREIEPLRAQILLAGGHP